MKKNEIIIDIPQDVNYIIEQLENKGFKAYIVGGCVRDSILGRKPKDWDICTNAQPTDVFDIFQHTIPTGVQHGTVTVMINGEGYEVTTFRKESQYDDSRHPNEVIFVNDLEEDLARRDFKINAMAYGKEGLIDLFDGLVDLELGVISCVGNPFHRFEEDALRMLRAVRFSAQLGFTILSNTHYAINVNSRNLENVSKERIRDEFHKILLSDSRKVATLIDIGLMSYVIPQFDKLERFDQNNPYHDLSLLDHTLRSVASIDNELHLKLTMLLHDIGKVNTVVKDADGISHYYGHADESATIAEEILADLKYDKATTNKVLQLIKCHDYNLDGVPSIKKLLNKIGEDLLRDLIKVQWADILAQNPVYARNRLTKLMQVEMKLNEVINTKECFSVRDLAINGVDLLKLGFKGREIGYILNELLNQVIEDKNLNYQEILLTRAEHMIIPDVYR